MSGAWALRPVADLLTAPIRTGVSKPGKPESRYRCLTLSAVRGTELVVSAVKPIDLEPDEAWRFSLVPQAFYVVRGNGNRALVGRGAYAPASPPPDTVFPDLLFELRLNPEAVNLDYFALMWGSEPVRSQIEDAAKTAAGIYKINTRALSSIRVPVPDKGLQRSLAVVLTSKLSAVDAARRAARDLLAAAEALPAAYLREAFGDEPCLAASPSLPTEPRRGGWAWHRLMDIARLATGHTPSRRCPEYWTGEIPWIQLPDIRERDGRWATDTSEHTNQLGLENSAAVLLPKGTVCLSRTASVGFVTIMGRPMATSQDFVNWVCGPKLEPEFVMHLLRASRQFIRDLGSGAVHHTIYFPTVQQFSVCIPDIDEQRRIAADLSAKLAAADRLIALAGAELAAVEALPAALLREAFQNADQPVT